MRVGDFFKSRAGKSVLLGRQAIVLDRVHASGFLRWQQIDELEPGATLVVLASDVHAVDLAISTVEDLKQAGYNMSVGVLAQRKALHMADAHGAPRGARRKLGCRRLK